MFYVESTRMGKVLETKTDLVRQLLADATGLPVVTTEAEEPVLLGSAMLGAVALVRYRNRGDRLYHERFLAGYVAGETWIVVTPDLDS